MRLNKFNNFKSMNESSVASAPACRSLSGRVTLYRLSPVVDAGKPGKWWFTNKEELSVDHLDNADPDGKYIVITGTTDATNIDCDLSEQECAEVGSPNVIHVVNDSLIKINSLTTHY